MARSGWLNEEFDRASERISKVPPHARPVITRPAASKQSKTYWQDIEPADAVNIVLPHDDIQGPLTQEGVECPWPWEPQQLVDVPLGMYHCGYCGEMVIAGMPHTDYREERNE